MHIRQANSGDIPAILELGRTLHGESHFRAYPLDTDRVAAAIGEILGAFGNTCLLLAESANGELAGMLSARIANLFYFDRLVAQEQMFYVHPAWRGSSAATKLIMAGRRWAANRGASEFMVSLNGGIGLEAMPRLMERLGFTHVGQSFSLRLTPP